MLTDLLISAIPAALCFSIHELSHGLMALALGDDTAKRDGRLSLNPLRHIDPFGFLMLILVGFGWAKPVMVDMRRFKNPKLGMAATAFAGPLSNFLPAAVVMAAYGVAVAFQGAMPPAVAYNLLEILVMTAYMSISLGVFNLIPVPPLDGSKVVEAVLPERTYYTIMRYEKYGMLVMFAVLITGVLDRPLSFVTREVFSGMLNIAQFTFDLVR